MNQGLNPSVMSQGERRPSLLKKENKRMNFLSRRQSAQPQPIKSSLSSLGQGERRRSELPSFLGDTVLPQPVQHSQGLPTSASVAPQILGHRGRVQDLDQIDVLDETNPWGVRIHHDGPYEAANVQVNKRAGHVPLGLASSNGLYNAHALQANDQTYIPPQVPSGVSLKLSPGQILPRRYVPFQPAVSSTLHGPYTPHFLARPLLSPPNEPQYTNTTFPDVTHSSSQVHNDFPTIQDATQHGDGPYTPQFPARPLLPPPNQYTSTTFPDVTHSSSQVHNDLPTIQDATQHGDDLSSSIGMAMLELTDNVPMPSPYDEAELPDEEDNHYDPVNLGFEHRRVPSPPLSAQPEPSRGQANQSSKNASSTGTSLNELDVIQPPPMYSEHIDDDRQPLNEIHLMERRRLQSSSQNSQNSLTSQNPEILAGTGPQRYSNVSGNGPPSNDWRNVSYLSQDRNALPPSAVSRGQRVEVAQGTQYTSPAQTSTPFLHPRRDSLPLPSVNHRYEPDVQSTHYSASSYSSGQSQSRRPPRSVPSCLVMPSPLSTGPRAASLHDSQAPSSQISNTRAPVFGSGGRKLRKNASMIVTPTPGPVIATVSFAPPMIGFHHDNDKGMAQSKIGNKPRRLLSKKGNK